MAAPGADDDNISVCSDTCSQKTCSDCCSETQCADANVDDCDGFIDCDGVDACTEPKCEEPECRSTAPPCFDARCLNTDDTLETDPVSALQALASGGVQHGSSTMVQNPHPWWQASEGGSQLVNDATPSSFRNAVFQGYGVGNGDGASQVASRDAFVGANQHWHDWETGHSTAAAAMSQAHWATPEPPSHAQDASSVTFEPTSKRRRTIGGADNASVQRYGSWSSPGIQNYPPSNSGDSSDLFDRQHSSSGSSQSSNTQISGMNGYGGHSLLQCRWGNDCHAGFYDVNDRNYHIIQAHVSPNSLTHCKWNHCEAPTLTSSIPSHLQHQHVLPGDEHDCLWADCNASFGSVQDLSAHVGSVHSQADEINIPADLLCEWDQCGTRATDFDELMSHLQETHYIDPNALSSNSHASTMGTPATPQSMTTSYKVCQWVDENTEGGTCGMTFPNAASLHQHVREAHIASTNKKTQYKCEWKGCSRNREPFPQKSKLDRHLQVHTGFKSCQCETCGKEFSGVQALMSHARTHTGEKPYECETCGKRFTQGSALTMHRRTHTQEKPLKCDFPGCNKTFSESSNLSKHKKVHSSINQYHCTYPGCSKSFRRLDQLKRHHKVHNKSPSVPQTPQLMVSPMSAGMTFG